MRARGRIVRGFACLALVAGVVAVGGAPARAQADLTTPSATTKSGAGEFANLKVTVGQTEGLVDQNISVTWSGGAPTLPGGNRFAVNYLQFMQCWGDTAPEPETCQYGAASDNRGGDQVVTRQLNYGSGPTALVDPLEGPFTSQTFVPFKSVTGVTPPPGNSNQFFDLNTTNEVPFGLTHPDGTGFVSFETQTALEAPGLGCGAQATVGGVTGPRSCWLVVVPRGRLEVDNSVRGTASTDQLVSSPLSLSNWAHRIVFPLKFAPIGAVCPLGGAERHTVGVEAIADAMQRWQPTLCAGGTVYGFSGVADSVARRQLTSTDPGLAFVNGPLSADQNPLGASLTYAPVALSGVAIGFDIDRQAALSAPPAEHLRDGEPMTDMRLTPRLVAKLLTQSYVGGVPQGVPYLGANPQSMETDPDFLALNPEYKGMNFQLPTLLTPLGDSSVAHLLWRWIGQDKDAADFIAGYPDPWGMRVNPFYQGLSGDLSSFPKQDPFCQKSATTPPLCTLDNFPYTNSMHDGARSVSRGDSLARTRYDFYANPPAFKKVAAQLSGEHALMAFSDTVTADRYGLAVAKLQNASGAFVEPTDESLLAGYQAMSVDPGSHTLVPNPGAGGSAYPLTIMTYGATVPAKLSVAEARDYAALLRYAAGPGQTAGSGPGQLPFGYVPLPPMQRALALSAATSMIRDAGRPAPTTAPTPDTSPPGGPTGSIGQPKLPAGPAAGPVGAPTGSQGRVPSAILPGPLPSPASSHGGPIALTGEDGPAVTRAQGQPASLRTLSSPVGANRWALVCLLVVGGTAAGLGAAVPVWGRRFTR